MREKGRITSWNDEKGYGFISPVHGEGRTFIHIRSFANRSRRPVVGDVVTYSLSTDDRGRPRAEKATITGVKNTLKTTHKSSLFSQLLASGFLLMVGGAVLLSAIPMLVLPVYLVVSAATFVAYAFDKKAAEKGSWRTSESTLHLLALVGGWPGALSAQGFLRHKTRKQPFRVIFWATVVLNCAAFSWLFTSEGEKAWRSIMAVVA